MKSGFYRSELVNLWIEISFLSFSPDSYCDCCFFRLVQLTWLTPQQTSCFVSSVVSPDPTVLHSYHQNNNGNLISLASLFFSNYRGGQEQLRKIWSFYFHGTKGLIFVVDSSDRQRIQHVKAEVEKMVSSQELAKAALLVFANKQDLPNAMSVEEITEKLDLEKCCANRKWFVQPSVATTGDGLHEGLDWLSRRLNEEIGDWINKIQCFATTAS